MSRRSLRLDDGVLDRSLPLGSASFSAGGVGWRSTRSLKSRGGSHHAPSSRSLLLPPSCVLNTSVMSDASLLSSLLDESSVRESTLVDTFWGLDQDIDPKESTMVADQSTVLADCTLIGSDGRCPKHVAQTISRVYCKDCELSDRKHVSSSKYSEPETPTVYCRERKSKSKTARSGLCGVMNVREALAGQKELHPNGSLCKKAGDVFRRLNRRWHHMTTGLTRQVHLLFCLRRVGAKGGKVITRMFPLRLLLVLLPLLLLFSVCLFGPASLQSLLPAVNLTEWRTVVSDVSGPSSVYSSVSSQSHAAPGATEESGEVEQLYSPPPAAAEEETSEAVADESARLGRLERSLRALWERVEAGGQRAEQRHAELLHLYTDLLLQQQLVSDQSHGDTVQPWLNGLLQQQLEQQLEHLQRRLDEERRQTEQSRQQDVLQQQSQTARLDQLELQLQKLAARTEDMQQRREAATTVSPLPTTLPAAIRGGVERQSHDALLAEVARLKAALERVRRNVGGLSGCRDGCRGLDTIHQTISEQVSARVREEVRVLVYGNQLSPAGGTSRDDGGLQESLLQWLSRRYVSEADLQVALSSLERSVLQNISLQLEELKKHRGEGTGGQPVQHAAAGDAVTREEVQVMVKNALRLFSQDRTGMADYALESGGGSVLSTRCSETFETKAALLSLFGLPLWYFSQSPRAVIQPDVHPGNCWAFRGSTGFLVIRLSMKILPTAFSLEHIPKILAPSGALHSAPRDFNVYGLDDESQEKGKLLGSFTYEEDGEALQTYAVTEENDRAFQIIEVQVLSNWGHQEYTCMYRFRVHGTPRDT
ncbi:hypothetical protein EPR50_G00210200 [Perca flavescens]|uniref:SUN domain-containing protein n=1 Tax=Perca flavescens TaxID=8167 RepID=A0A484C9I4_PERFV|nr:hypothetical protein EPR50_G00210200 [Perca flavescens]